MDSRREKKQFLETGKPPSDFLVANPSRLVHLIQPVITFQSWNSGHWSGDQGPSLSQSWITNQLHYLRYLRNFAIVSYIWERTHSPTTCLCHLFLKVGSVTLQGLTFLRMCCNMGLMGVLLPHCQGTPCMMAHTPNIALVSFIIYGDKLSDLGIK